MEETKTKAKPNGKEEISKRKEIILNTKVADKLSTAIDTKTQAARDYQIAINWEKEVLALIYDYEGIDEERVSRVTLEGEILKLEILT